NIVNKVAESGLITIDLQDFYPEDEIVVYDIKQNLFHELILKEKDFRAFVKDHDWEQYEGKHVAVTCSADAIILTWPYMLITSRLQEFARSIHFGNEKEVLEKIYLNSIGDIDFEQCEDKRLVIKGCSDKPVPEAAYILFTQKLIGVAKSVMYGEPCSTVPVYKRKS